MTFPKISDYSPKISKSFQNCSEGQMNVSEHFPHRFRILPKISEDTPNIPEEEPIMFRSYSNTPKDFLKDYVAIAMVIIRLVKISYFHL